MHYKEHFHDSTPVSSRDHMPTAKHLNIFALLGLATGTKLAFALKTGKPTILCMPNRPLRRNVSRLNLIASVIHFHIIAVDIQFHVFVAEHGSWPWIPRVAGHVIRQHQDYMAKWERGGGGKRE